MLADAILHASKIMTWWLVTLSANTAETSHSSRTISCIYVNNQCYWKFIMNLWHLAYSVEQCHLCKEHLAAKWHSLLPGEDRDREHLKRKRNLGKYLRLRGGVDNRQAQRSFSAISLQTRHSRFWKRNVSLQTDMFIHLSLCRLRQHPDPNPNDTPTC